jgi:hypothetical protein
LGYTIPPGRKGSAFNFKIEKNMTRFLFLSVVGVFVAGIKFFSGDATPDSRKPVSNRHDHGKNNEVYINYLKCRFNYGCIGAGNGFDHETNRQPAQNNKQNTGGDAC